MNGHLTSHVLDRMIKGLQTHQHEIRNHMSYAEGMVQRYDGKLDVEARYFLAALERIGELLTSLCLIQAEREGKT